MTNISRLQLVGDPRIITSHSRNLIVELNFPADRVEDAFRGLETGYSSDTEAILRLTPKRRMRHRP